MLRLNSISISLVIPIYSSRRQTGMTQAFKTDLQSNENLEKVTEGDRLYEKFSIQNYP